MEILQLCRLCLVKDQVNIPIFEEQGDIRQIFLKITACLPIKVSKEDNLPKKICDGCLYKLELLYQFWNTTANAEKQLISWLNQAGMDVTSKPTDQSVGHQTQLHTHPVKQETVEPTEITNANSDDLSAEAQNYILQQQQLTYDTVGFPFQEIAFNDSQVSNSETGDEHTLDDKGDPMPKRRKRQFVEKVSESNILEDNVEMPLVTPVTKTEEASDTDGEDNVADPESPNFGTMDTEDNAQPGPSGMGKASTDTPSLTDCLIPIVRLLEPRARCNVSLDDANNGVMVDIKKELIETTEIKVECDEMDATFRCRICKDAMQMNLEDFKCHYKTEHKNKRLPRSARTPLVLHTCEICAKNFRSVRNLNEHMETHNNHYDCDKCSLSFKKVLDYTLHMRTHSEEEVFKCIFCDYKTENINEIKVHLNIKHENRHRYTCKICNKGFDVLTWFKEHDNFHSGVKPFVCEYCGKGFLYSRYLSAHKNSMHKEEMTGMSNVHECVICKKKYQHKNSLKVHMNVHTGNVAVCHVCGKQLSSKEKLKFHLRIHTGYKPYKCSYCEKCFTKKPILVEHERIHTGERPYDCEYCHKCFSQRSSLVIHIRSHTGERPYVCHVCNKGFVARAMLNIHFRTCKGYCDD